MRPQGSLLARFITYKNGDAGIDSQALNRCNGLLQVRYFSSDRRSTFDENKLIFPLVERNNEMPN